MSGSRTVYCAKLKAELPGLDHAPLKGDLGERIYRSVSKEAWGLWMGHATMVINEYHLNPSEPEGQRVLKEQIEKFFFSDTDDIAPPPDFVPKSKDD